MWSSNTRIIGGDVAGACVIDCSMIWFGPKAQHFKQVRVATQDEVMTYRPEQIVRAKDLSRAQSVDGAEAARAALGGAVLLGPVGLAAGLVAGRKNSAIYGLEFEDGKKIVIENTTNPRDDKPFQAFLAYLKSRALFKFDF